MTDNYCENTYVLNEDDQKALSEFKKNVSKYCQEQSSIKQRAYENKINRIIRMDSRDNYRELQQGF